jgi:hypothetical protein
MSSRRLTPAELGIENVNLKTAVGAGSIYTSSPVLDVRKAFQYTAIIDITETGSPTAGEASFTVNVTDEDGNTTYDEVLLTAIDTQTNGSQTVVSWGIGKTVVKEGSGTLGSNLDVLGPIDFMEVVLTVTTANDGTTSTGSVTLLIEEV